MDPFNKYILIIIIMSADLAKGLDTPELKIAQSMYSNKETRNKHNLSVVRQDAVVNAGPAVAPNAVTLILMESMRKC